MTRSPDPTSDTQRPVGPLDLNLLVTFDAVMSERNLRRAAERLGKSQPAVSHAVARLRDIIGDVLFEKIPTGIAPTPRAEALWEEVRDPLRVIAQALDHRGFDPREVRSELVLGLSDDVHDLCFAWIAGQVRTAAPHLALRIVETDHRTVWSQVSDGAVDLAVTVAGPPPRGMGATVIGEQRFVLLHRSDQMPPTTLESYLSAPHVAVGFSDRSAGYVDERLAAMSRSRRIVAWTPRFVAIPDLVRSTGALATMPEPFARAHAKNGLSVATVPFDVQPVPVRLCWHQRRRTDPLNEWAREIVSETVRQRMFE